MTRRHRHAQHLLDMGKARLLNEAPYIIQLKYNVDAPAEPKYALSLDPGRTNIGISVIDLLTDEVCMSFELVTNNKDVTKHMSERAVHRSTRRRGERLVRKRRSHRLKQVSSKLERDNGRVYRAGQPNEYKVDVRGILNQEARFDNRKREPGWFTPTATHLFRTFKNLVKRFGKFVPISDVCLEFNKFVFMQLENGKVYGVDYRNGRMRGFSSVEEYVANRQEGCCAMPGCQKDIEHYHHITPRSRGGSNRPENIAGVCEECHAGIHKGELCLPDEGEFKRFAGTSVLNQVMPRLASEFLAEWGGEHFHLCFGYETKLARERLGLPKTHDADAVAIVAACLGIVPWGYGRYRYAMRQYRRQDRALIKAQKERTYKLGGKIVAKNRKPRFEQPEDMPALSTSGLSRGEISRLRVLPSYRSYNDLSRVLPGALYEVAGRLCVLTGRQGRGRYLLFKFDIIDDKSKAVPVKVADARLVCHNKGLVFTGRLS